MPQYTIRNIPAAVDHQLRDVARRRGMSLNEAAIDAMKRGLGVSDADPEFDDLDDLIGTWKKDRKFNEAIADQDRVDPELWQ